MPPSVLVVGSLHYDMMVDAPRLPRLGETLPGSAWSAKCGGKGGNQAVEAARHGAAVSMVGCVGPDEMGSKLVANLQAGRVDCGHVRVCATGSGLSMVVSETGGDYGAVIVSGANLELGADDLACAAPLLTGCAVLVLQNEIPDAANVQAARIAASCGGLVVWNAAPARPPPPEMAGLVDVLVVNAIEAEMLGAAPVTDLASAAGAAVALSGQARVVIVTAGGDGLAVHERGVVRTMPPHAVRLVSTHGAGDAFVGAFATRLAHGDDTFAAATYANAAAAMIVSTPETARSTLTPADVRLLLDPTPSPDDRSDCPHEPSTRNRLWHG